jgi:hypothetical protein
MRILGVDPGAKGAIALLVGGVLVEVHDMPALKIHRGKSDKDEVDGYELGLLLRELRPDIAFVEQVGGMEGQAAGAAFNFGRAAGAVEYALKALGVRVDMVSPVRWKRELRVTKGKDGSLADAKRLWPHMAASFRFKKDNDRAEAALIAEWGRKFKLGEQTDDIFE